MHEVHAALAIMALKRQVGQKDRVSEDEFYAQFREAPWSRLRRLVGSVQRGLLWRPEARAVEETHPRRSCQLADA